MFNKLNLSIMKKEEIRKIALQIKKGMGGNAKVICSGDCTTFAKKLVKKVGGVIIATEKFDMYDEILGFKVEKSAYKGKENNYPHVFVKIDGRFYDAFNCAGKSSESQMKFRTFKLDKYGFIIEEL
jgi:hypothetical protein